MEKTNKEIRRGGNKYDNGYCYCSTCMRETYHSAHTVVRQGDFFDLPVGAQISLGMKCKISTSEDD